jgi:hypothetical protein
LNKKETTVRTCPKGEEDCTDDGDLEKRGDNQLGDVKESLPAGLDAYPGLQVDARMDVQRRDCAWIELDLSHDGANGNGDGHVCPRDSDEHQAHQVDFEHLDERLVRRRHHGHDELEERRSVSLILGAEEARRRFVRTTKKDAWPRTRIVGPMRRKTKPSQAYGKERRLAHVRAQRG